MANEWIAPAFTLGGVVIGSAGTVLGNWLTARRQSVDKSAEIEHSMRESTRGSVLSEITKYVVAVDDWLGHLKRYNDAVKLTWDRQLEQRAHDDTLRSAYENPGSLDTGELEAHTPTVDREFNEAFGKATQTLNDLIASKEILEKTSPMCEIVAPPQVATHVEKLTAEALAYSDHLYDTDWLIVAEQEGVTIDKFVQLRNEVTSSTRAWSHPTRK